MGQQELDLLASLHINQCQLYFTLEWPLPPGSLWLNTFNHLWKSQVSYFICYSCNKSCSVVKVSSETCNKSIQASYCGGAILDGGSLVFHNSQHAGRHSSMVSHHKSLHQRCFSRLGAQGCAIAAFNPLAAQRHVLHRQGFSPPSVRQWQGNSSIYNKGLPVVLEGIGRLLCSGGCMKQCCFFP